ncbi:insulinase family protein [Spirochaeta thermophila]|uniref:Presequence protease 1 n=1 Tax=Winmispira thermophila (strain ATCC 49972 / DSM 6192 / RI 19.B1) TaxID=665571 RepID=E0RQD4_WINT6|nr:insulinase family protein [Spirochaeta thermophila]ADN02910.1 presequence protease 1 [Spirochaeta thermophila DSM 6192]
MQHLTPGTRVGGFLIKEVEAVPDFRGVGIRAVHEPTGAEVYHLFNDDEENFFAFVFKTLPEDDKGTPHILEHTVLCGSQRFPLKDPFAVLMKGSLATFLNAMTYPDRTIYPAGSTVKEDYFNLMRVYGDAVFFPLLKEEAFLQEGHRLEFTPDGRLVRVGVVYNEMKGAYSDPEAVSGEWSLRGLFSESAYRFESGGDPSAIPHLSYEEFVRFHGEYYHPSRCRIMLYGNIPTEEQLAFLEREFLSRFEGRRSPDTRVPFQVRWEAPRRMEKTYGIGEGEPVGGRSIVTVNWLLTTLWDRFTTLSLEVLSEVLVGHDGSPLRKALLESGLGEDVASTTGIESEIFHPVFSAGLKGTDPERAGEIEECIFSTLEELAEKGIDDEVVESVLRRVEFRFRELPGKRNAGLSLIRRVVRGWIYDIPPGFMLEFLPVFEALKVRLSEEPGFFPCLIREYLLENPHRLILVVRPEPGKLAREEEAERRALEELRVRLSEEERRAVEEKAARVRAFQQAEEDAGVIPLLRREDLPREVERIPQEERVCAGVPVYVHPLATNGIVYVDLLFPLGGVGPEDLPYVPLLVDMVEGAGLPDMSYDRVAVRLSLTTGGFSVEEDATSHLVRREPVPQVVVRVKMLEQYVEEGLFLVRRLLEEPDLWDERRLRMRFLELKQDFVSSIVPSGHSFMSLRAEAAFSRAMRLEEVWGGVSQFFFLRDLERRGLEGVGEVLERMRRRVVVRRGLVVGITGRGEGVERAQRVLEGWFAGMAEGDGVGVVEGPEVGREAEAFVAPSKVAYVAQAVPALRLGEEGFAAMVVVAHLLKGGPLWERVRMEGGAYGAFAGASAMEGLFTVTSYRDPHVKRTIQVVREVLEGVAERGVPKEAVEQAVRGVVGREIAPDGPGVKGFRALRRRVLGIGDEVRQAHREGVLGCGVREVQEAARRLVERWGEGRVAVLGDEERVAELEGVPHRKVVLPL